MYFHLMCRVPHTHRPCGCMSPDELIDYLTARNLHAADSDKLYWIEPRTLVRKLYDEAAQKIYQTEKTHPQQVRFLSLPSSKKNAVQICAVAKVSGKDELLLFAGDLSCVETYVRQDFPLIVW